MRTSDRGSYSLAVVALTIDDRERLIRVLDGVRMDAFAELRAVVLQEQEWRLREELGSGHSGI
jgi:hypothetical protein